MAWTVGGRCAGSEVGRGAGGSGSLSFVERVSSSVWMSSGGSRKDGGEVWLWIGRRSLANLLSEKVSEW